MARGYLSDVALRRLKLVIKKGAGPYQKGLNFHFAAMLERAIAPGAVCGNERVSVDLKVTTWVEIIDVLKGLP